MTETPALLFYTDSGIFGEIVVREVAVEKITPKTVIVRHSREWSGGDDGWTSRLSRYSTTPPGSAFARQDAGNHRDYYRSRDDALKAYCLTLHLAAQSFRRRADENDATIARAEQMIRWGVEDPSDAELKAERVAERERWKRAGQEKAEQGGRDRP